MLQWKLKGIKMIINKVYLSLGSNIGNSFFYLLSSINKINSLENTRVSKVSRFYITKPWGNLEQNDFLNCAVEIYTKLLPVELLKELNKIEKYHNRKREVHWGPRTIDIDIIFYSNLQIQNDKLTIPHKEYKNRNFVLVPLLEIIDEPRKILRYINKKTIGDLKVFNYDKKIMIASCLCGNNVRYDGKNNYSKLFMEIIKNISYCVVCPEVFGGLPIPRKSSEILNNKVYSIENVDLTREFVKGAEKVKEIAKENNIEIAIVKEKSPSCGYENIYNGNFEKKLITGMGLATRELVKLGVNIISI